MTSLPLLLLLQLLIIYINISSSSIIIAVAAFAYSNKNNNEAQNKKVESVIIQQMKVRELKSELDVLDVDYSNVFEKEGLGAVTLYVCVYH